MDETGIGMKKLQAAAVIFLAALVLVSCAAKTDETADDEIGGMICVLHSDEGKSNGNTAAEITMYAPDGKTAVVPEDEKEDYENEGWYDTPVRMMYASDGRTLVVAEDEANEYESVGWYTEPVRTMYAPDGRSLVINESETKAYEGVGWYTEPVRTMYAPDGRTQIINESETEDYKKVGWYESADAVRSASVSASAAVSASSGGQSGSASAADGVRVYRTPTGKRYHLSPSCGGKNSTPTTLQAAQSAGLTPCKKCAY